MLGAALASGICASGVDVTSMGVAPTPAVSHAARSGAFDFAAVISASHNPAEDNGIKLLGSDGAKLKMEDEAEISSLMNQQQRAAGVDLGRISADAALADAYLDFLVGVSTDLSGMRIAVDCAHGAAAELAPRLLKQLGAEVTAVGAEPDGDNINAGCGATHPAVIHQLTIDTKSEVGISFDGDADRCVFSDERGRLINGDRLMAHWAVSAGAELSPKIVVGTVMSNLGFERALLERGITLERTPVGDRHVADRMKQTGAKIGGEQSGHIIFGDHSPTGDGLLTAIQLLNVLKKSVARASELEPAFDNWPQVMINVRIADRNGWDECEAVTAAIQRAEASLDGTGRVVVRASGTQPMIRVMVEAQGEAERDAQAEAIVSVIEAELGGTRQSRVDLTNALGD
jgi:phosphoglucosamine mutase